MIPEAVDRHAHPTSEQQITLFNVEAQTGRLPLPEWGPSSSPSALLDNNRIPVAEYSDWSICALLLEFMIFGILISNGVIWKKFNSFKVFLLKIKSIVFEITLTVIYIVLITREWVTKVDPISISWYHRNSVNYRCVEDKNRGYVYCMKFGNFKNILMWTSRNRVSARLLHEIL